MITTITIDDPSDKIRETIKSKLDSERRAGHVSIVELCRHTDGMFFKVEDGDALDKELSDVVIRELIDKVSNVVAHYYSSRIWAAADRIVSAKKLRH